MPTRTNNPVFQNIQNKRFKNATLDAKAQKLASQLSGQIKTSMNDLSSSVDYIINDPDKSDSKKMKDIRIAIYAQKDLVSMHISDEMQTTMATVNNLEKKAAPESSPEDVVVLQHLASKGLSTTDLQRHPELANIVTGSKYGSYLFGERIAETARSVGLQFNLGDDYDKYVNAKAKTDLAEEYASAVDQYLNEMENQIA